LKLLREPLVHFFLVGAAVFGLYALFSDGGGETGMDNRIVVTDGRVQQLAEVFAKTWQRPPTPQELRGLIDAFVKEEIYYREDEAALAADDAELQAYLDANKAAFRVGPRVAFDQVFINPKRGDEPADARAKETLETLKSGASPEGLGDPTLLPAAMELSSLNTIERDFGDAFAQQLTMLPLNAWTGPIESPFGLHLVRVTKRVDGYDPALADIRDAVAQKWRTQKREEFQRKAYEELRSRYEVVLPAAKETPAQGEAMR
jgi:parvulin-like peptidyl-prolyl isomerase